MGEEETTASAAPTETTITFTFHDGSTIDSTFTGPYGIREQLGWEEHFRLSFYAVEAAGHYSSRITPDTEVDAARVFRTSWILWFGWHRARPGVASKFSAFLDTLADFKVTAPEAAEEDGEDNKADDEGTAPVATGEEADGAPEVALADPTPVEEPSALVP